MYKDTDLRIETWQRRQGTLWGILQNMYRMVKIYLHKILDYNLVKSNLYSQLSNMYGAQNWLFISFAGAVRLMQLPSYESFPSFFALISTCSPQIQLLSILK